MLVCLHLATTIPCAQVVWRNWTGMLQSRGVVIRAQKRAWKAALLLRTRCQKSKFRAVWNAQRLLLRQHNTHASWGSRESAWETLERLEGE